MDTGDRQTRMLVEVFIFLVEIYECFVIWNTSHLSDVHFTNIFSQSVSCIFILTVSFEEKFNILKSK